MSGIHPEALPLGVWLTGDAGTHRRSCIVTPGHVALPPPHRSTPAAAPRVCRLNRPDVHAGMPCGGGARGVSGLWLYICYALQVSFVFSSEDTWWLLQIFSTENALFCFVLIWQEIQGWLAHQQIWKRVFEGLDFFKKPQMNIHLWIQLLLWLLFFKLLAS